LKNAKTMTNFEFKNIHVEIADFKNAKGQLRYNILIDGKNQMGFYLADLNKDSFLEDIIFNFRDSANRNSPFNKKADCIAFAEEIREHIAIVEQDSIEKEQVSQITGEVNRFEKEVSQEVFAYVLVKQQFDKNNNPFQEVQQEYTNNSNIYEAGKLFEEYEISKESLIEIIEKEGFKYCSPEKFKENRELLFNN